MKSTNSLIIIGALITSHVFGTEYCVTTSAELVNAFDAAESNGQHDVIKIAQGSYDAPIGGFVYDSNENFDITISGGWSEFFGNPCGQQLSQSAYNTVLDGNGTERVMWIETGTLGDVHVSSLFFLDGFVTGIGASGGGLDINGYAGYVGNVTVENSAFFSNRARFSAALDVNGYHVRIRNNMFAVNHSEFGATVGVISNDGYGAHITNNTVYVNTTDSTSNQVTGGLRVFTSGTSQAFLANNLLWGNDLNDLSLGSDGTKYLKHNNIGAYIGSADEVVNNLSVEPMFDPGLLNFTPSPRSPLVNAGINSPSIVPIPVPFDLNWGMGTSDVEGNTRRQLGRVDIGAVESPYEPVIFANGFDSSQ